MIKYLILIVFMVCVQVYSIPTPCHSSGAVIPYRVVVRWEDRPVAHYYAIDNMTYEDFVKQKKEAEEFDRKLTYIMSGVLILQILTIAWFFNKKRIENNRENLVRAQAKCSSRRAEHEIV